MTYSQNILNDDVNIIYIKVTILTQLKAWLKRQSIPYRQHKIIYFYKENKAEVILLWYVMNVRM